MLRFLQLPTMYSNFSLMSVSCLTSSSGVGYSLIFTNLIRHSLHYFQNYTPASISYGESPTTIRFVRAFGSRVDPSLCHRDQKVLSFQTWVWKGYSFSNMSLAEMMATWVRINLWTFGSMKLEENSTQPLRALVTMNVLPTLMDFYKTASTFLYIKISSFLNFCTTLSIYASSFGFSSPVHSNVSSQSKIMRFW